MKTPTKNQIADALVAVELETKWYEGKPLIEETIRPAEVASFDADAEARKLRNMAKAMSPYVTLRRADWQAKCELAESLYRDVDNERTLCLAVMRVSAEKDAKYEALQVRCERVASQRNAANEMLALVERERDEAAKDVRWYRAAAIVAVALAVIGRWM